MKEVVIFNRVNWFSKMDGSRYFCLGKSRDLGTELLFYDSSRDLFCFSPFSPYVNNLYLGPRVECW